jgi:hypothetical protein
MHSISTAVPEQQQADTIIMYMDRHGSNVNSLKLWSPEEDQLTFEQFPPSLQLHSLDLAQFHLQLLPGSGVRGVLGPATAAAGAPPLKQLRLTDCVLLDRAEVLAAALLQLPALQHLSLCRNDDRDGGWVYLPTGVLQQLPQLTYLELACITLQEPDPASPALQPLQALTRLADLRLADLRAADLYQGRQAVTASMLSGMCHLTHLALISGIFEPAALANKAKLQHLELAFCTLQPRNGAAGLAALLSQLLHQTQLTHLDLRHSVRLEKAHNPPAAAYAALTASTKLRHLDIWGCTLPAGVWQHMFAAGRQLLHLTSLDISHARQLPDGAAPAPEGSQLVSCCPSLQSLSMSSLQHSPQQLTQLQGLSGLHTLCLATEIGRADRGGTLQAVGQLTGLRKLGLYVGEAPTQLLITQLQQLRRLPHLTALFYGSEGLREVTLKQEVSCTLSVGQRCINV